MNIVLSCYAQKGKGSFILEKDGKPINVSVFNINKDESATLKEYTFEAIIKGLNSVKSVVEHDDLLLIVVQNRHICNWLNGTKEYKTYSKYLDTISSLLDMLDCRYLFTSNGNLKAKKVIGDKVDKEVLEGAVSFMECL